MNAIDKPSLPADYFERMFAGNPDPWAFETSPYELAKFSATIAAIGERRYPRLLEVGCANGVLTQHLAPHCDALVAIDVSETALTRARKRLADSEHVTFTEMTFPGQAPQGVFDLIVLSEVVYYWNDGDIASAGAWIDAHLGAHGDLLLVHWTGETDYPQTADGAVHKLRAALPPFTVVRADRHDKYRLDLWRIP